VRATLDSAISDPVNHVTIVPPLSPATPTPSLNPEIMAAIEKVSGKINPGVPILPAMSTGATDGIYTTAAGIPTYGISGIFIDKDGSHAHGLNERIRVSSLMEGRRFQYQFIKVLADQ
jgi:acetylornithine deacetylase/succinyl-diaminopimelate desuccinylase-like protein